MIGSLGSNAPSPFTVRLASVLPLAVKSITVPLWAVLVMLGDGISVTHCSLAPIKLYVAPFW